MKHAILFTYLHCSKELDEYEEYIVRNFARVVVSQHSRVLNLGHAIRLHESQSNHLLLTSFNSFSDLITTHIINPQGGGSSQGANKCAKNIADPDAPVCKEWNLGKCTTEACQYKHICSKCRACHQVKNCTSAPSSSSYGP